MPEGAVCSPQCVPRSEAVEWLDNFTLSGKKKIYPGSPRHASEVYRPGVKAMHYYDKNSSGRYVGKLYTHPATDPYRPAARYADGTKVYATEVISRGLEEITTDPIALIRNFPELFDFIFRRVIARVD